MNLLKNLLLLSGLAHFGILIASALTPKVLDWKREMAPLHPFLRRLFWVYGVFIVLVIIGFGTLTLFFANEMAEGQLVARSLAGFIAIFWNVRLIVQWFVFDARPFLKNAWLKMGYQLLTVAFVCLTAVYAITALRPAFIIKYLP